MQTSGSVGRIVFAALLVASWSAGTALGQQAGGPAGIAVGPFKAIPGVDLAIGHDDNLFSSDVNKRGSSLRILSPYVRLEGAPAPHKFDVGLRYDLGRYGNSPDDNYDDYALLGNADVVFTGRAGLRLRAEHRRGHDPRGSTDRPLGDRPDVYKHTGADGVLRYGATGAQGRIELDGGYYERRYQNNRPVTEASDYNTGSAGGTFLWRVQPRTDLLLQAQRRNYDYQLASSTLDSTEDRLYAGARWQATARTDGSVKIGRLKKDFRDSGRTDFSGGSWDVGVRWSPRTYSAVDFLTSKQTNESTGFGDAILTKIYGLSWTHDWNSRFRSQLFGNWRNDHFQGASVAREDDSGTFGVRFIYQFRRWLRFGAEYARTERDSNIQAFDYKRNLLLFTVGATL